MKRKADGSVNEVERESRRRTKGIQFFPAISPSTNPIGVMKSKDSKNKAP